MSDLSFGKLIVPSLLTTGAVFTALSAPVVMFADTPLNIRQGDRVVYDGMVRNAALPYLALAGTASVSLGVAVVASAGWRKASKQADKLSDTLENQAQRRAERQAHLEAALASENYMKKSGLDFFLEDGELTPFVPEAMPLSQPPLKQPLFVESASAGAAFANANSAAEPPLFAPPSALALVRDTAPVPTSHEMPLTNTLADQLAWLDADVASDSFSDGAQAVIASRGNAPSPQGSPSRPSGANALNPAPLPSAQGFYGFSREVVSPETPLTAPASAMTLQDQQTIAQINSLQNQLQAVVSQIDALRSQLPSAPVTVAPVRAVYPTAGIEVVSQLPEAQSGLVRERFEEEADDRRSGEDRRSEMGAVDLRRLAS
jgi:hypothetical protein